MIYLLLSIAASTCIFVIFKLFDKYNINTLQAIVVNYSTACLFGLWSYNAPIKIDYILKSEWLFGAIGLGILFISIFNVMALTAQRNGLSVASVASKMSVIIPVIFGVYVYKESAGLQKITGIILALASVYLTSVKPKTVKNVTKGLWLPVILFFGSGIIDTSVKYIESTYLPEHGIPIFLATIFAFGLLIGSFILGIKAIQKPYKIPIKTFVGGSVLGIVNYSSVYFLLKALHNDNLESSTLFTINNVAIVMLSTLLGLALFKENISKMNWLGIALAIVSIITITLA